MDPDATYAVVCDAEEDTEVRMQAAGDLLFWVERGGSPPSTRLHASTLVRQLSLFRGGHDTFGGVA